MGMPYRQIANRKWYIDAVVKADAKQFRRIIRSFEGTERMAELRHAALLAEMKKASEKWREGEKKPIRTFGDILDRFLGANTIPESIIHHYKRLRQDCGKYPAEPAELQRRFLGGIDANQKAVKGYVDLLDDMAVRKYTGKVAGVKELADKLSPGTKKTLIGQARRITRWAYEQNILGADPLKAFHPHERWHTTPRNRALQGDEFQKIYNGFATRFPHYLPHFLHSCNMPNRINDLRCIRREDLNMTTWKVTYLSGKTQTPTTHIISEEIRPFILSIPADCPWLFPVLTYNDKGEVIGWRQLGDFKKAWATVKRDAKITNLRWHDLRHQAAGWLDAQGLSTRHIMVLGGWKTRRMVEVYHNIEHGKTADEAAELLAGPLKKERKPREKVIAKGDHKLQAIER